MNNGFGAVAQRTDIGRKRARNEDAMWQTPGIVAVADGMGGHEGGYEASRIALRVLGEHSHTLRVASADSAQMIEALEDVFQLASEAVEDALDGKGGTTLICAVATADGRGAYIAHAGDSRAYLLDDGTLARLTQDHNVYETLLAKGVDEASARAHPSKDRLVQALGFGYVQPDVARVDFGPEDVLMLCSDGVFGPVPEAEIDRLLRQEDLDVVAKSLIDEANHRGGPDNITVTLVRGQTPRPRGSTSIELLRKLFLFADLDEAQLRSVHPYLNTVKFAAGDAIATEGEEATDCLLLVSGTAEVVRGDMVLTRVGPGDHVGELALGGPWRRAATVVATSEVIAFTLSRSSFESLALSRPTIGVRINRALTKQLVARLADLTGRMVAAQRALSRA